MSVSAYDLVCPFLTDDPEFARGVEFGMLFARMKAEHRIDGYFHTASQEQITLLYNRVGWHIESMAPWSEGPEWTRIVMAETRRKPPKPIDLNFLGGLSYPLPIILVNLCIVWVEW